MIVTRTASSENLGTDLGEQITRYPRALGVGAAMLTVIGLVPGMPTMPFLAVASMLGFAAYQSGRLETMREETVLIPARDTTVEEGRTTTVTPGH